MEMANIVKRSISKPVRSSLTWDETWSRDDQGLIKAWENGRQKAKQNRTLRESALRGELPMLVTWKGGVEKKLKTDITKYGSLKYLAHLQGLKGEDLNIDLTKQVTLTCSRTGQMVTYTWDSTKYAPAQDGS